MKTLTITLSILFSLSLSSQSYIGVTLDNGSMLNADPGYLKTGAGCSVNVLIPNYIPFGDGPNFLTVGLSGVSYPHTDQEYSLSNLSNGIDDSFNYVKILVGYRIAMRVADCNGQYGYYRRYSRIEGASFEPRIGTMLFNFSNTEKFNRTVLFSPKVNYNRKNVELSLYGDYAQSRYHTNIGYITTFSIGLSLGCYFEISNK